MTTVEAERRKSAPTCRSAVNMLTVWLSFPWMVWLNLIKHVHRVACPFCGQMPDFQNPKPLTA